MNRRRRDSNGIPAFRAAWLGLAFAAVVLLATAGTSSPWAWTGIGLAAAGLVLASLVSGREDRA